MAQIHAQIGLDFGPCTKSCEFCTFSRVNQKGGELKITSEDTVLAYADAFQKSGADVVLLMASAAYPFEEYLEMYSKVRRAVGYELPIYANVRDLSPEEARILKKEGFNGAYHALRMSEGTATDIPKEVREATLQNLYAAGIPLSFCVEPVGEEHTAEEFYENAQTHLKYDPITGGVGRRIPVKGTKVEARKKFDQFHQALLIAIYRLIDTRTLWIGSANATFAAASGANLCWAEAGYNPRGITEKTELEGVGRSVEQIARIFEETGWRLKDR